jgi:hypothetical protein
MAEAICEACSAPAEALSRALLADDGSEQVVELVGDAADDGAQSRQAVGVFQLPFKLAQPLLKRLATVGEFHVEPRLAGLGGVLAICVGRVGVRRTLRAGRRRTGTRLAWLC